MAWTKSNTAIVAVACVLLAAGLMTMVVIDRPAKPIRGIPNDWSVLSGSPDQWSWNDGVISGHSTTGDSILASSKEYRNFTLSVIAGTTNREASLAIRFQDADNGYILFFTPTALRIGLAASLWPSGLTGRKRSWLPTTAGFLPPWDSRQKSRPPPGDHGWKEVSTMSPFSG